MKMKLVVLFSIATIFSNLEVLAQNSNETIYSRLDSVYRYQGIIPPVEFQYDINQLFRQPLNEKIPMVVLFSEDRSNIWLRTEMMISNHYFISPENEFNTHFTSSLHKQFLEEAEFDMIRYVLGMAQLSAVAYLAYRHVKKYGFLK